MIVCSNCDHENPEGATLCETCYTPLPVTSACPNCGATIEANATFCGQCGFNLAPGNDQFKSTEEPLTATTNNQELQTQQEPGLTLSEMESVHNLPPEPEISANGNELKPDVSARADLEEAKTNNPALASNPAVSATQLQIQKATLFHVQTNIKIELPQNLAVIHLGKPNTNIPPDIDISGFPNSQFVSRVHADIRVEGDAFYIEDTGSSNGTYINHNPLAKGNRHRLRPGDRIALGKEDKVSFIFQVSSE